ncbi:MAG: hypothetical protein ACXAC5_00435 [Promethearchaeota archaeon]|jgi:hypothetical protein
MNRFDYLSGKDLGAVPVSEMPAFALDFLNRKAVINAFLDAKDTLNLPWDMVVLAVFGADSPKAGKFIERYVRARLGLVKAKQGDALDSENCLVEIKFCTECPGGRIFRQVRFDDGIDYYLCLVGFRDTNELRIYRLSSEQMYMEAGHSNWCKGHRVSGDKRHYQPKVEYNVRFDCELWEPYRVDASIFHKTLTQKQGFGPDMVVVPIEV